MSYFAEVMISNFWVIGCTVSVYCVVLAVFNKEFDNVRL